MRVSQGGSRYSERMPRANRLSVQSGIFHLTHRCHDQPFHLRFARDRNYYREGWKHGSVESKGGVKRAGPRAWRWEAPNLWQESSRSS
jgi:hypothetical protein